MKRELCPSLGGVVTLKATIKLLQTLQYLLTLTNILQCIYML